MFQLRRAILLSSALVLLPFPAIAADVHWTGTTSTDWADPSNWLERHAPEPADTAYLTDPNPTTLTSPTILANLSLTTNAPNPYGVPFVALTAASPSLTVTNSLSIGPDTALSANGTLLLGSLDNRGFLAVEPGTLTLTAPAGHTLDLDGSGAHDGTGVITLWNLHVGYDDYAQRRLVIDAPLADAFDGRIGATGTVTFNYPWTAGPSAQVYLGPNSRVPSELAGAPVSFQGHLSGPNYLHSISVVSAPITLTPSAVVSLNSGHLRLDHATFAGATVTGDGNGIGRLYLTNPADVTADTIFNSVPIVGGLTVHPGVTLTYNDPRVSSYLPGEGLSDPLQIITLLHNATLKLGPRSPSNYFNAWRPYALVLHDGASMTGAPVDQLGWRLSVLDGVATVSNDITIDLPAISVASSAELRLDGKVNFTGSYYGYPGSAPLAGTLRFRGGAHGVTLNYVAADLTVPTLDLDGLDSNPTEVTIGDIASLTLNTNTLDPDDGNSFDGTLHNHNLFTVNTPAPWTAGPASTLELIGSHGYQSPRPTIAGSPLRARGLVTADAWESQVTAPLTADGATVNVSFGTLYVPAPLSVASSLTKTGPATLAVTGPQSHAAGAVLRNTAGTLELRTDAGSPTSRTLALQTTGDSRTYLVGDQHFASLALSGSSLVAPYPYDLWPPTLVVTDRLTIRDAAALDLQRSNLVVLAAGGEGAVRAYLASGYDRGTWVGPGIRSSFVATDPPRLTSIGYALASDVGLSSFAGQPLAPDSIVVRTTWAADANLDNLVEADDLARLEYGYAHHLAGWSNGDFNYDDAIDAADYLIYYRTYVLMCRTLPPDYYSQLESRFGPEFVSSLLTTVPEPSSLYAAWGLGLPLLTRRRRHRPVESHPVSRSGLRI